MKKTMITLMLLISFIFAGVNCVCENSDAPIQGEATIDGSKIDWDLTVPKFDVLNQAGKSWKPITSKIWMMHNYGQRKSSILVVNEDGYVNNDYVFDPDEYWVKDANGDKIDLEFAFTVDGWEAKFSWTTCGCSYFSIHHYQEEEETSANEEVEYFIDCSLPVELSAFEVTNLNGDVVIGWTTESETENLGFIIDKRISEEWFELVSYKTDKTLNGQGSTPSYTDYVYIDEDVQYGTTYEYRLADVNYNGVIVYHSTRTILVDYDHEAESDEYESQVEYGIFRCSEK